MSYQGREVVFEFRDDEPLELDFGEDLVVVHVEVPHRASFTIGFVAVMRC